MKNYSAFPERGKGYRYTKEEKEEKKGKRREVPFFMDVKQEGEERSLKIHKI